MKILLSVRGEHHEWNFVVEGTEADWRDWINDGLEVCMSVMTVPAWIPAWIPSWLVSWICGEPTFFD